MRKLQKALFSILLVAGLVFSTPITSFAEEISEDSTEIYDNIITISSTEDFLAFSENCRLDSFSKNLFVSLDTDIDLTDTDFEGIPIFYGTFDGGRHRIKGFELTSNGSNKGLFRYVGETATIKNLIVEGNLSPDGSRSNIGGIAGNNAGHIENCVFSGFVTGADYIGGLVGVNELTGIIENCQVYGTIHGDHFIGGIAGENNGVIRNCSNMTKINTTEKENSVEISDITFDSMTSSESAVTATDIGGITGSNNGVIRSCENHGKIGYQHIGYNIGGIAGSQIGYITNCTNYATILGRKEIGGIVGQLEPNTTVDYDADTFQILEGQLNRMSVLTNRASTNAQNNTNVSDSDLAKLSSDIDTAQNALDILGSTDGTTDPDSALAARNNLAGSLSGILETSGKIANENQHATDTLSSDLQAVTQQASAISSTLSNASDNLGGSFTDVSDQDTDDNIIGKVENCTNSGAIEADLNVGGITGAITLENDLDPESDITFNGNESYNFNCEVRAVIKNCTNQGNIVAKRQYAGGILGLGSIGLVHSCTNTGKIDATQADYVGGIAGQSHGYIRFCNTKCILSGSTYVGGISGMATTVSNCRSMVQINDASEKTGAILGYSAEDSSYENNYYLPIKTDLGGIDGISYETEAKPLSEEEFFALENLPDMFKKQTLKFVFDGGSAKTITLDFGERIKVSDIPSVPKKEGYRGTWDGYNELISSEIVFDETFTTVYTSYATTIQSRDTRENGAPILLAESDFTMENTIKLATSPTVPSIAEDQQIIEALEFVLPTSKSSVTLRYALPQEYEADRISIMVQNTDTTWKLTECTIDGSYMVFNIENDDVAFCAIYTEPDYTLQLSIAGGCFSVILIVILTVFIVRHKRTKKAIQPINE